jgi:phage terminase large subunit-like protein
LSSSVGLTLGPVVADFFANYLCHPKGPLVGTPLILEPWQREFVNEFYRVDENGDRLYRQALLGVPRGNGKTPLAAGIGLFELMTRLDAPEIYNIAGAEHQAQDLTDFSTAFVDRGRDGKPGELRQWLTAHKKAVTHKHTFGAMKLLASSGALLHSKSVSVAIADELHGFTTSNQIESLTALVTALHKRPNSFSLGITTAGFALQSLLGGMYLDALAQTEIEERNVIEGIGPCLLIGRNLETQTLFVWYGPPNDDELELEDLVDRDDVLRACNPATWLTTKALRLQRTTLGLDEYDFLRLHFNAWTHAKEVFIPMAAYRQCRSELKPVEKTVHTYVAVDIGLTHDTSAVSWSQPAGLVDVDNAAAGVKVVSRCRIWSARPDHRDDRTARHVFVRGGRMELSLIEAFIEELAEKYALRELVYDPTFFEGEAQRLKRFGIKTAPIYQAGVLPEVAYQRFYQDVKEGKALHADDKVLARHVAAATGVKTERGWRVSELRSTEPIDGLQALAMSHWRASRQVSIYEDRGFATLGGDYEDEEDDVDDSDDDEDEDD